MKTKTIIALICIGCMFTACKKEQAPAPAPEPEVTPPTVTTPKNESKTIELKGLKTYNYFNAPKDEAATSVLVSHHSKLPYAKPITVKFIYNNGDSYTYIIPETFGLWRNQNGKWRVVTSKEKTVWLQGQTKSGKFMEFVFFGDPKYNDSKVKPNSYKDQNSVIKHKK